MLLLMLVAPHLEVSEQLRRELADTVLGVLRPLAGPIEEEVRTVKGSHVKGYRCGWCRWGW